MSRSLKSFAHLLRVLVVETLVKTATHRRCGKVLTNIPAGMDKSSSTKEAISEYRNSDFQFSGKCDFIARFFRNYPFLPFYIIGNIV